MSSLYFQEPPTFGKVLFNTTVGDIDIELWSKEAPKACRNFVQLCMEKYYDGTLFHRLVKSFIVQGGDPNGDGTGGQSIYGNPFKDEFHSRLRYVRRGLIAMANGGKDDNGSQFFFTLGPTPELQNKNTIFGKVSGDTLYNMLKLEECLVDGNDRPLYPHKIISSKVLLNPFPDIVPRVNDNLVEVKTIKPKPREQKNYKLLSFGEEAEEEETEVQAMAVALKRKGKSSHDLVDDPKLSSVSAASLYENDAEKKAECLEQIKKKLKTEKLISEEKVFENGNSNLCNDTKTKESSQSTESKEFSSERDEVKKQIKLLKKELRKKTVASETHEDKDSTCIKEECIKIVNNPLLEEFHEQRKLHESRLKDIPGDKAKRQQKTMELLAKFQAKIQEANEDVEGDKSNNKVNGELDSDDEKGNHWLTHSLQCSDNLVLAKDANIRPDDWYDLTDPRHPINERRRLEKKATHV